MGAFKSVQAPVKQPSVVLAVVAGVATVYAFWELRIRASKKQGLIPQTMSKEWQEAEHEYLQHVPFQSNPHKFARLNPHRHSVPPSAAVLLE
ncbi:hypothetical protein D9Q98_002866 [Chlorella vulgaris]|uniref:Uncharacterized protein n=1 Tax=Chlorella vulgaris TaxID=3077 RepID=A0A9D4TU26_CHLVU|nr:hypothetical protein D9Q98_002866 [Chlorella vulgaris]